LTWAWPPAHGALRSKARVTKEERGVFGQSSPCCSAELLKKQSAARRLR
jgi:hypothetical protein